MPRGVFVGVIAILLSSAVPRADQVTLLKLRVPVERTLEGNARDTYGAELAAGECASITVEQRGIDVVVSVLDASGGVVATIDDEVRRDGREHVTLVADSAGTAGFTVAARYPKNAAGTYTV